jgi:hypothetical protein
MLVYRRCSREEIDCYLEGRKYNSAYKKFGINTFNYDDEIDYIHFYLYKESCIHPVIKDDFYIICDIPDIVLNDYFGYGYYPDIIENKYVPIPEFCIPKYLFKIKYIKSIEELNTFTKLLDYNKYQEYLNNIEDEYMMDFKTGKMSEGSTIYSVLCKKNNINLQ